MWSVHFVGCRSTLRDFGKGERCVYWLRFVRWRRWPISLNWQNIDIEIKFDQLFRHPQNWRYSSSSEHEIPVLSKNLIVYFQVFETSISRLTSVLPFTIIFDTIPKNKPHKTHLRYHSAYDSRYNKTEFLPLETRNVFRIVPYKTDSKNVTGCREFQWKTDRYRLYLNSVSKLSCCLEI
jgi:hypothetical protein